MMATRTFMARVRAWFDLGFVNALRPGVQDATGRDEPEAVSRSTIAGPGCSGRLHRGRRRLALAALVLLAGLALFSLGAGRRTAWRTDELRYLEVVREMALPGASRVVPRLGGLAYDHKPPGFFWAALALHRGLGLDLESAGKGVSVVAAAVTVALVFDLGTLLGGIPTGLAATAVLASAQMFTSLALRANLDALLAALVTAALYSFARAQGIGGLAGPHTAWLRGLAGVACGLAVLVKGPVAVGIPAVVVLAHTAFRGGGISPRRSDIALRPWLPALAAVALPSLVWLGLAYLEAGPGYVSGLVLGHAVAHPFGLVSKLRPAWFYLGQLPVGFAPWSLLLPAAVLLAWRRRAKGGDDLFLLAWTLAPLALLSLFPAKRHLYLLPAYPGAALLVGRWLVWSRQPGPRSGPALHAWSFAGRVGTGAVLVAASLAAVALAILAHLESGPMERETLAELAQLATPSERVAAVLAAVLAGGAGMRLLASLSVRAAWRGWLVLAPATLVLMLGAVHPLQSAGHDSSAFYAAVARIVAGRRIAVLDGTNFAPELRLYGADVRRVRDPLRALEVGLEGSGQVWLLAEKAHLDRAPSRSVFETLLRYEPTLGKTLLLLRARVVPTRGAGLASPRDPAEPRE